MVAGGLTDESAATAVGVVLEDAWSTGGDDELLGVKRKLRP